MNQAAGLGLALVLFGGLLNGSFALPMKRMPGWKWENTWLVYSLVGMVAGPGVFALITVPQLGQVFREASWHTLILVAAFGLGSGTGSMLFGLGIARMGLALGFAIILGTTAALGSILPLAILHPDALLHRQGHILIL